MRIGFTCGAFDLTHAGHYMALREARAQCDFLIVAVQEDPSIDRPEKHKPVQDIDERCIQVQSCRWVDIVYRYSTEKDLLDLLNRLKEKVDVRFLGEDWKEKEFTGKDLPIEVVFTSRSHNYSSSSLRERVKKS